MQNSFRPVALRLPRSDVAARAAAPARLLAGRRPWPGPLAVAFRFRLPAIGSSGPASWEKRSAMPRRTLLSASGIYLKILL